jgi:polyphenol oxidase
MRKQVGHASGAREPPPRGEAESALRTFGRGALPSPAVTPFFTEPRLAALAGVRHGFFGRDGGVSHGIYASLNCGLGSSDDVGAIAENRGRVAAALGAPAGQLVTPYQVHGTETIVVEAPWPGDARPHADALVTNRPGIAIAVGTADCGPVLLADPGAGVVGAAHAGWKGALSGIL